MVAFNAGVGVVCHFKISKDVLARCAVDEVAYVGEYLLGPAG